jgi:hypothetical protein|tara:strand:+ start:777 stop:1028 length:252 start_codon:yes stop_codon:yes gene_type:complete
MEKSNKKCIQNWNLFKKMPSELNGKKCLWCKKKLDGDLGYYTRLRGILCYSCWYKLPIYEIPTYIPTKQYRQYIKLKIKQYDN